MKNKKALIIGAIVAAIIQSGLLAKIIYDRAELISNGTEVNLQSGMVDPRDLFRGHYVTLNLSIGRISAKDVEIVGALKKGEPIYVTLKRGIDEFWIAESLFSSIPNDISTPIIKGELRYIRNAENFDKAEYRIKFPFDRFFAPKKKAKELEKVRNGRKLGILVSLSDTGEGVIKGISVEGETIYNEPIY